MYIDKTKLLLRVRKTIFVIFGSHLSEADNMIGIHKENANSPESFQTALGERRLLIVHVYHCPISAAVSKQLRKNSDYIKNDGFRIRSGLKAPAHPSCLAAKLHS